MRAHRSAQADGTSSGRAEHFELIINSNEDNIYEDSDLTPDISATFNSSAVSKAPAEDLSMSNNNDKGNKLLTIPNVAQRSAEYVRR